MKMKNRKYFAFFASFFEAIDECPIECQRDIYRAITLYGIRHEEMPLTGVAKAIFISLKPVLDSGWKQFNNGNKGGAPTGNRNAAKINPKTTQKQPNSEPKTTKEKIKNKKEKINTIEPNGSTSICIDSVRCDDIDYDELMAFFNAKIKDKAIKKIRCMTTERKKAINARLSEYGKESLRKVIDNAADSDFLNGGGERGFVASFDWLFQPTNFLKVLEGNYANVVPVTKTDRERLQRLNGAANLIMQLRQEGTGSDD